MERGGGDELAAKCTVFDLSLYLLEVALRVNVQQIQNKYEWTQYQEYMDISCKFRVLI